MKYTGLRLGKGSCGGFSKGSEMVVVELLRQMSSGFDDVRQIRWAVFVNEQGVSALSEFDELDAIATHFLLRCDGVAAGTARLYRKDGVARIGRVAVLQAYRGRGLGAELMTQAVQEARRQGCGVIVIHAQVQAQSFYARLGFEVQGKEFEEEGIPHVAMKISIGQGVTG